MIIVEDCFETVVSGLLKTFSHLNFHLSRKSLAITIHRSFFLLLTQVNKDCQEATPIQQDEYLSFLLA